MVTGINTVKSVRNLFRTKLALVRGLSDVYNPAISRNKEKLIELMKEKAEIAAKSEFARKLRVAKGFYTLEMAPPSNSELKRLTQDLALVKEFMKTGCYRFITVKQAFLLFLVCWEISLWFYLGETIGKWHIIGYKVKAHH